MVREAGELGWRDGGPSPAEACSSSLSPVVSLFFSLSIPLSLDICHAFRSAVLWANGPFVLCILYLGLSFCCYLLLSAVLWANGPFFLLLFVVFAKCFVSEARLCCFGRCYLQCFGPAADCVYLYGLRICDVCSVLGQRPYV